MSEGRDEPLDLSAIREYTDPEARRAQRRTLGGKLSLFELAELAEMTVGDIYTMLSRRLHRDPDLRALFALVASEEQSHARRVGKVADKWQRESGRAPAELDTSRVRKLLAEAQNVYDELENNEYLDERVAMKVAMSLEEEFEQAYVAELEETDDPLLKDLFTRLVKHGPGHNALLTRGRQLLYRR